MNEAPSTGRAPQDVEMVLGLSQGTGGWRRRRRLLFLGAVLLVVLLVGVLVWPPLQSDDSLRYITEPARRGDLVVTVIATGSIEPTNQVEVSSELSGIIRRVNVDYNSRVAVGQVLAELDTDKLKASVESSRARLAAARAQIKEAEATVYETQIDYERKRTLAARNVASVHDLDAAKATYQRALAAVESAKADAAAAEADLRVQETDLAKACICSPINGIVLSRNAEPGQTVASTLQAPVLFTIAEDLTEMEVQVDVDEADVGKVREGQQATFTVDAHPDRVFAAEIRELRFGSEIVQGVVTYKAVLITENTELLLRPGMTATAEITVEKVADALTVPNAALRFSPAAEDDSDGRSLLQRLLPGRPRLRAPSENLTSGTDRRLWVLADGQAQERPVTIGPTDGSRTQVIAGDLQPDEAVIVDAAAAAN